MADTNEKPIGYQYPAELEAAIGPITPIETDEEREARLAAQRKRTEHFVPITPESADKIKQYWEEQGGDAYRHRQDNFLEKKFQDLIGPLFSKSYESKAVPKNLNDWMDTSGDAPRVDYDTLRTIGIPQEIKAGAMADVAQNALGVSRKIALAGNDIKAKPDDTFPIRLGKTLGQTVDQFAGVLGSTAYEHVKAGGRFDTIDLPSVLNDEERSEIQTALAAGKPGAILRGGITVSLKPFLGAPQVKLGDVYDHVAKEKIKYVWDQINDATDTALTKDVAMAANLLPVLGLFSAAKAAGGVAGAAKTTGALGKALKGVSFVANPLTESAQALRGGKSVPLYAMAGLSALEGAGMQRVHLSEQGREGEWLGRALGAGFSGAATTIAGAFAHALGKGHAAIQARRTEAQNQAAKDLGKLVSELPPERIHNIALGKEEIPDLREPAVDFSSTKTEGYAIPAKQVTTMAPDPTIKKELKSGIIVKALDKDARFAPDARAIQHAITALPHDDWIKSIINFRRQQGWNETPQQAKMRLALLNVLKQTEDSVAEGRDQIQKFAKVQMELPLSRREIIETDLRDHDILSNVANDDELFSRLSLGSDRDFIEAFKGISPSRARVLEFELGRISDADLMKRELIDIFRMVVPDKITDVASVRNSAPSHFSWLDSLQKWWNRRVESQGEIDKVLDKAKQLEFAVGDRRSEALKNVDTVFTRIKQQTPISGEGADISHATIVESLSSLRKDIERATVNGTTIDPLHSSILAKDAKNFMSKEELEAIQEGITSFNELQERRIEAHDHAAQILVDKIYMNRIERGMKSKPPTSTDLILQRLTSGKSANEIVDSMNQYFTKYARDMEIDPANLREVTGDFKIIAESIVGGSAIPDAVVNRYIVNSGKFIESVRPSSSGRLRKFGQALENYNREATWLDNVSKMIEHGYNDPVKFAAMIVPRLGHIAEYARSPSILRRFEILKAAGHDVYMKAMREIDLPATTKSQMYEAQAGGLTAKLRLAMNPNFVFHTESHIQNVFKATKEWDAALFKAMVEATEAAGVPVNKEHLLGFFLTPHNNFDKSGYLLKLTVDAIGAKEWAKIWARNKAFSNNRFSALANYMSNTEYMMGTLNHELGWGLLHEEQSFAGGIKTATLSISEDFKEEFTLMLNKLAREWAEPEFKYGFNKLQGSRGILAVDGFFYGYDNVANQMIDTSLGMWHQHAFIQNNQKTVRQFETGDKAGFVKDTFLFLRKFKEYLDDYDKTKTTAEALWDYFNDAGGGDQNRTLALNANAWKNIWDYIRFQSKTLNKAYKLSAETVASNNELKKSLGYNITMPEWRRFYVYEPSKTRYDMHEFTDRLFRDLDETRHFGSSDRGQLEKAERIVLHGPSYDNLAHPAQIIYDYVHHNLMSAHTIHSRTHLENFGMLIRDQGYENLSNWVMDLAQNKLRGSAKNEIWDGRTLGEQLEQLLVTRPGTRAITLAFPPVGAMLGTTKIVNALNSPKNLLKNLVQASLETMMVHTPFRGASRAASVFYNTIKNYFWKLDKPLPNSPLPLESLRREVLEADARGEFLLGKSISPGTAQSVYRVKTGLSDAYDRSRLYTVQLMTSTVGEASIGRGGGKLTRKALGIRQVYDKSEDIVRKLAKEREESSISMAHLQIGARVHDTAVVTLHKEGTQKAYEYLTAQMPNVRKNVLWGFVTEMKRGLDQGNPNFVTDDFLYMFHAYQNGRFSPTAAPQIARSPFIRTVLPQLFMFANAKALRPFRYLDILRNIRSDVWKQSTRFMAKTEGMPSQMQKRVYLTLIPGLGIPLAFYTGTYGAASYVAETVADKWREQTQPGSLLRQLIEGTGIPLTEWGPLPGVFADARTRSAPFGVTAAMASAYQTFQKAGTAIEAVSSMMYHTMKNFMDIGDEWEDFIVSAGVDTEIDQIKAKRRAIMEIEDINARDAEERKLEDEMLGLQKRIEESLIPKFLDHIIESFPATNFIEEATGAPSAFLKAINMPTYRAYIEREAMANDRLKANDALVWALEGSSIGRYTGSWSAASAVLGITGGLGKIADANPEETKKRLMEDYQFLGESPEVAEWFADLTFKIASEMDEEDLVTMVEHQDYGGKIRFEDMIRRYLKAQKEYVRPESGASRTDLSEAEQVLYEEALKDKYRRRIESKFKGSEK